MGTKEIHLELSDIPKNDDTQLAVCVQNGHKEYGNKRDPIRILESIDMNVAKGTIYGLLGASGCGKTTLLNCIIGLKQLDSGDIWVLGNAPSVKFAARLGYMPQQISLCYQFTIKESMKYFGRIAGMSSGKIEERTVFLAKLLVLPNLDSTIHNLSGGQQRRVSFATALLHEPELMILDEPTVGLDPLLRESIWEYLVELTQSRLITIILTTHYIDEAHQADKIGLMRNGYIIGEESPQSLLEQFNANTLEEAFYQLIVSKNDAKVTKRLCFPQVHEQKADDSPIIKKHVLMALLWKNCLWMWRNVIIVLTIFILPVVSTFAFCLAIGGDPFNLNVAVVNHETKSTSCEPLMCNSTLLSCHFLRYLDKTAMNLIDFDFEDDARAAVGRGKMHAAVIIKANYTDALRMRMKSRDVTDEDILNSTIDVLRDVSVKDIALFMQKFFYKSFAAFIGDYLESCDINKDSMGLPMRFYAPIFGKMDSSLTDFANPGIILTLMFFLMAASAAGLTLIERNEGILERSLVMGVNSLEILTAHAICQFVIMLIQAVIPLVVLFVIFNLTLNGSILVVFIFTVLSGFCGMCAGFSISSTCSEERTGIYILLGVFFPFILLSGCIWPIEGMDYYLRTFSAFLPLTIATDSLRSVLQRGWGLDRPMVYHGVITLSLWTLIFMLISFLGLKYRRK